MLKTQYEIDARLINAHCSNNMPCETCPMLKYQNHCERWEAGVSYDFLDSFSNPPMHILEPSDLDPEPYETIPCDTCCEVDCNACHLKRGVL